MADETIRKMLAFLVDSDVGGFRHDQKVHHLQVGVTPGETVRTRIRRMVDEGAILKRDADAEPEDLFNRASFLERADRLSANADDLCGSIEELVNLVLTEPDKASADEALERLDRRLRELKLAIWKLRREPYYPGISGWVAEDACRDC